MRTLSDTIARLTAIKAAKRQSAASPVVDRLSELGPFGPNPGALQGRIHVPRTAERSMPLVVVLHGCTQSAAQYDSGSGWSELADEAGFALLFPEQAQANNLNRCFNWFESGDIRRDAGEAASIRHMIDRMIASHAIDRDRVYITGLSAGGAMAAVMLATYPEVFAGGAIIAGLPYGVATTIPEAFDRMRGHGLPEAAALGRLVACAAPDAGGWPSISIWHGTADQTVDMANAGALAEQWRQIHDLPSEPVEQRQSARMTRRIWRDGQGRVGVEQVLIEGMGHGTPIAASGPDRLGTARPYMLDVGISSTRDIARSWGLASDPAMRSEAAGRALDADELLVTDEMPIRSPRPKADDGVRSTPASESGKASGIQGVIEDALRKAGLM